MVSTGVAPARRLGGASGGKSRAAARGTVFTGCSRSSDGGGSSSGEVSCATNARLSATRMLGGAVGAAGAVVWTMAFSQRAGDRSFAAAAAAVAATSAPAPQRTARGSRMTFTRRFRALPGRCALPNTCSTIARARSGSTGFAGPGAESRGSSPGIPDAPGLRSLAVEGFMISLSEKARRSGPSIA